MRNTDCLQMLYPLESQEKEMCLESTPDGSPRIRVSGSLLSINGQIALGYLALRYRPIPLIRRGDSWIPKVMKVNPRAPKTVQRCPLCGSPNLSRPVYRDAKGIRWANGVSVWFAQSSNRSPPS